MIKINLLPHREEKKIVHRRQFQWMAILTAIVTVGIAGLTYIVIDSMINAQNARNAYLNAGIESLNKEIAAIETLKQEREVLLTRKRLVEELQKSRGDAVRIFDQLIRHTPDGIYLSKFDQKGSQITLMGYGQSMARVSDYMTSLVQSNVFTNASVVETQSTEVEGKTVTSFILTVEIKGLPSAAASEAT